MRWRKLVGGHLNGQLDAVARVLCLGLAPREEAGVEDVLHVVLHLLQRVCEVGLHAQRLLRHLPQVPLNAANLNLHRMHKFAHAGVAEGTT